MSMLLEPPRLSSLTHAYDEDSKAHAFVQLALACALEPLEGMTAAQVFQRRWPQSRHLELVRKAATPAGTTTDATWAGPLAPLAGLGRAFVEMLRPATVLGRLVGSRRVPFQTRITVQTTGTIGSWVGEGRPTPVGALGFATATIDIAKIGIIACITKELARSSDPAAIPLIEADLRDAIAQATDINLLDPAIASVPGLHPASLTNGAPSIASSGSTAAAIETDLAALLALVNNGVFRAPYLVLKPSTARHLMTLRDASGARAFPDVEATGGSLGGIPVLVSESAGNQITLIEAADILTADGGIELSSSDRAVLEMDSTPTHPAVAATVQVSLYQLDLLGVKALRFVSWKKARASSVAYISGVTY